VSRTLGITHKAQLKTEGSQASNSKAEIQHSLMRSSTRDQSGPWQHLLRVDIDVVCLCSEKERLRTARSAQAIDGGKHIT
jgi:hypothetical protein